MLSIPVSSLPRLNACLNAASAILLVTGFSFIRRKKILQHKICMLSAVACSAVALRQTQSNRSLDLPDLAVRLNHRRRNLLALVCRLRSSGLSHASVQEPMRQGTASAVPNGPENSGVLTPEAAIRWPRPRHSATCVIPSRHAARDLLFVSAPPLKTSAQNP